MKVKKLAIVLLVIAMLVSMTACGQKKCANGCGKTADPNCMAEMCDKCCTYWSGLNGCYKNH